MSKKALLLGDSICTSPGYSFGSSGYAPVLAGTLPEGDISVDHVRKSKWSTRGFLAALQSGDISFDVDLTHFNVGLHDIAVFNGAAGCAIPLDEYQRNLVTIVETFQASTGAALIWASTTPVIDDLHRQYKRFVRREVDVSAYNLAAATVMQDRGVVTHDLHEVLVRAGVAAMLGPDGVHPNEQGRALLAEAVHACIAAYFRAG